MKTIHKAINIAFANMHFVADKTTQIVAKTSSDSSVRQDLSCTYDQNTHKIYWNLLYYFVYITYWQSERDIKNIEIIKLENQILKYYSLKFVCIYLLFANLIVNFGVN